MTGDEAVTGIEVDLRRELDALAAARAADAARAEKVTAQLLEHHAAELARLHARHEAESAQRERSAVAAYGVLLGLALARVAQLEALAAATTDAELARITADGVDEQTGTWSR